MGNINSTSNRKYPKTKGRVTIRLIAKLSCKPALLYLTHDLFYVRDKKSHLMFLFSKGEILVNHNMTENALDQGC